MNQIGLRLRGAALAGALVAAFAGPAYAHAHLTAATPPADGTVTTAPSELTLTFSEGVNAALTAAILTGADGKAIATGKEALKPSDDHVLIVPVSSQLAPGTYTVKWHALSNDGHKTKGSYQFTIKAE